MKNLIHYSAMDNSSAINEARFRLILESLGSCHRISEQLNLIDNLSAHISDGILPNLIESSGKINNITQCSPLEGPAYHNLLHQSRLVEPIIQLIPRLSKCIENRSMFDEAVELLEQVAGLNHRYGSKLPIIDYISRRSEEIRAKLVSNLSDGLNEISEYTTEEVSKIIEQLHRCGDLTDRGLKLKYLQARDKWFNDACERSEATFDDVVHVHCDRLLMIYNEYTSIFCGQDVDRDPLGEDGAIINSWLLMKISIFITSLEVYLNSIHQGGNQTPTMLGDTMQRCFELSRWLASIGFDFSSRLEPLFIKTIGLEVRSSIDKATETFETSFTATISKSIESLLLPIEDEILRISNMRAEERLPDSIEHYPVFKIYCLHIINSLRWLHICKGLISPISLCLITYEALGTSLTRVTKALATALNLDSNSKHPILTKIAISYITEVLPFLSTYCEAIFPKKEILNTIGLSVAHFKSILASEPNRLSNFCLNHRQIAEPLKSTMPTLLQTIE